MLLLVEILLFGTAAVWLIGLFPALVVTAVKGNSRLLGWGFFTLGLAWFVGALALAPADSFWARRHYDSEQVARSRAAFAAQRSPRMLGLWLLVGADGAVLERSLPHTGFNPEPCTQVSGGYACGIETREASGDKITYEVKLHGRGCWTARPVERVRVEDWGTLSGCITLLDYL